MISIYTILKFSALIKYELDINVFNSFYFICGFSAKRAAFVVNKQKLRNFLKYTLFESEKRRYPPQVSSVQLKSDISIFAWRVPYAYSFFNT